MASASPRASAAVVDDVGARFIGQARFLGDADVQHHLALLGQRGLGVARHQHDGHPQALERRQDREHLVGLAGVRQRHDHVGPGPPCPGHRGPPRRDAGRRRAFPVAASVAGHLPPHVPRLAHAGDDDAAGANGTARRPRARSARRAWAPAPGSPRLPCAAPARRAGAGRVASPRSRPIQPRADCQQLIEQARQIVDGAACWGRRREAGRRAACDRDPRASP